ncbi:class I SAM-dependent methyltransferase [Solwaraspora sp. WMMD1047]|uniref:O-methyltransferase n=1 Tax=Solwaraspora sp. WMMD1047 TaxID=3016102 RepID=UPI0024179729|nr:class I SAM-dependent methyltransferase [Solwaraspora sp. WMMD1047]MDG4828860.1 class I SAM-dependent methyltransferase [Solwaraspora sp. WMMD1047]
MQDEPVRVPEALAGILADAAALGFEMSCENRTGAMLATLAASKPAGRILELGTGAGAGAAWLLDGMSADARLISVEIDPRVQAVAVARLGADPRVSFESADVDGWLTDYDGEPFDLAFVDCLPGKFHRLDDVLALLRPGGLYVGDDLLPQPTWPAEHQERVDGFLDRLPRVAGLRATAMAWGSGLVVGARI